MTPEEASKLTLGELEAIAKRLEGAVKAFREAQSLLGGTVMGQREAPKPHPVIAEDPQLAIERERLLAQFRSKEKPDD